MSDRVLVAAFAPDRFNAWRLWLRTPGSETDSEYFCTAYDPANGSEYTRPISQSDIDRLPKLGKPLLPATFWFVLDAGTEPQKLIRLAQGQPEMIASVHSQVNLSKFINVSVDRTTPLLEVIKTNKYSVVPDLLAIGANPIADIAKQLTPPIWTTAFDEALKMDRIRILHDFVIAGVLETGHLEQCRTKYKKVPTGLPREEAEYVSRLLDAANARLERGPHL